MHAEVQTRQMQGGSDALADHDAMRDDGSLNISSLWILLLEQLTVEGIQCIVFGFGSSTVIPKTALLVDKETLLANSACNLTR